MISSEINIIELPSNLGLKNKPGQTEPGVRNLPKWFKQHGLHQQIKPKQIYNLEPPAYSMLLDSETGVRNTNEIIDYAQKQAELLYERMQENSFQLIIGGDCSILLGSALALRKLGNFGLFFLDGHTDFIGPEISQTGGAAGMDLAIVTGHGHSKLTNIQSRIPYFEEKNVFCIGNREYDSAYIAPILESEIQYFDLKSLRNIGMDQIAGQFLKWIETESLDGFLVHLDVDVLDDLIMPAVDSRSEGGLTFEELAALLKPILSNKLAIAMEITILDPTLDKNGIYTKEFIRQLTDIISYAREEI